MTNKNQYFPQSRPYPGVNLSEKLDEMGLNPIELSEFIDVPLKTINDVINGKTAINQELAVQFEIVTKIPAHFWVNSQRNYDEFMEKKYKKSIKEAVFV